MSLCPECGSWSTKTLETRRDTRWNYRWRRKQCNDCQEVFESYEMPSQFLKLQEPLPGGKLERR